MKDPCRECGKTEEEGWHGLLSLNPENPWPHFFISRVLYDSPYGWVKILVKDAIPGDSIFKSRDKAIIRQVETGPKGVRYHYLRDSVPYTMWMQPNASVTVYPSPY